MILSFLITFPILSAAAVMLIGKTPKVQKDLKIFALLVSVVELIAAACMYYRFLFNHSNNYVSYGQYHFVERYAWVPSYNIEYFLGIDGLSVYFILLTAILTPLCLLVSWKSIENRVSTYFALFLLMEGIIIGFFAALDFVLFYLFFESVLIPMFFIIGGWGGENRIYATFKFFLYTFFGSVFMLVAITYIIYNCGSGDISRFTTSDFDGVRSSHLLWLAIFIAFAVKIPMWPFHTWLPDAHVQAPTGGSVILAGVLLKMGGYGMLRVLLPLMPHLSFDVFGNTIQILSIIAIIYTSFVALAQTDMKKMIAYSSVAHMGYVTAGIFTNFDIFTGFIRVVSLSGVASAVALGSGGVLGSTVSPGAMIEGLSAATNFELSGMSGAMMQMISHGVISSALFLIVGMLYERTHTKEIAAYGGLAHKMPVLSAFFMLFMLASVGLPGTSGFVGEFMVIVAVFGVKPIYGFCVATGMVMGAAYMLTLYRRVVFTDYSDDASVVMAGTATSKTTTDISCREVLILAMLSILVLLLGIYPKVILPVIDNTIYAMINQ